MGELIAFVIVVALIAGVVSNIKEKIVEKKFLALSSGAPFAILAYDGGHPELHGPQRVNAFSEGGALVLATLKTGRVAIPYSDITALTLDSNMQNVNTGGGRSLGGAVVGMAIAGPLGALVGARKSTKMKKIDESKTYLVVRFGAMTLQVVFAGGQKTYNQLAPLMRRAA
jgi:hypothetical protein